MQAGGKRYIVHGSRSDVFRIWYVSDIHWMSKACAEERVRHDIKIIKNDPRSYWIGGGDYCEFIGHTDKRFDPDCVADWVRIKDMGDLGRVGMKQLRDLFKPIRNKCLGLLIGNHEKRYELVTEQESLHHWLCTELDVPNLEYSALFDLLFVRRPRLSVPKLQLKSPPRVHGARERFRIFAHHGAGFAQTPGGKLNKLIQFMQSFDADIYFCGHVHDKVSRKEPAIGANEACNKLVERERLGVVSGSYLKTYQQNVTTYGEQRGYRPTSLGAAVVNINPETREMWAEV